MLLDWKFSVMFIFSLITQLKKTIQHLLAVFVDSKVASLVFYLVTKGRYNLSFAFLIRQTFFTIKYHQKTKLYDCNVNVLKVRNMWIVLTYIHLIICKAKPGEIILISPKRHRIRQSKFHTKLASIERCYKAAWNFFQNLLTYGKKYLF